MRPVAAVSIVLLAGGCASAEALRAPSIPPSMLVRKDEVMPQPVVWPKRKNGRGTTKSAMTTYDYEEDREYPIKACAGSQVTYFLLQPGERFTGEKPTIFGDRVEGNWIATAKMAGNRQIIAVSADTVGRQSSMMVTTDRGRDYLFDLTSAAKCQKRIKFDYEPPRQLQSSAVASRVAYDPALVRTNYEVKLKDGARPAWMPVSIFDMGSAKTWIELPDKPGVVGLPIVVADASEKSARPLRTSVDGNFIEIEGALNTAELRMNGSVVEVTKR